MRRIQGEGWAAGAMLVAMGSAAIASRDNVSVHVVAYAVAWAALAVLTMGSRPPRWAPAVLALVPLYLAGSIWAPETREGIDTWFQADHWRYLAAARDGAISPRHLGFPVFLGAFRGIGNATAEEIALRAGSAVAGALATGASLLIVGPSRAGVAGVAILLAGSFTLGRWAFAGVLESTMYSLALWAAALRISSVRGDGESVRPGVLGAILAAALGLSLDNVFLAVPSIATLVLRPGVAAGRRGRDVAILLATALSCYAAIAAAATYGGRVVDELTGASPRGGEHFAQFAALYLRPEHLLRPLELASTAFRVGVMAVVAQPGLPAASHSYDPRASMLLEPATIAWIVLAVVIAFGAWPGMKSRYVERSTVAGIAFRALVAFIAIRFAWHVIFAPREVILFSAQIHMALALLLASSAGATTAPRKRILIAVASVLGVMLIFVNGGYLVALP